MPKFSRKSKSQLASCDCRLQFLMNKAIEVYDFSVLCGYRNQEDQDKAYEEGFSKVMYPNGRHNKKPSLAVDLAPYPINFEDITRFKELAWLIKGLAAAYGIEIKWGGDFKGFPDWGHFELPVD